MNHFTSLGVMLSGKRLLLVLSAGVLFSLPIIQEASAKQLSIEPSAALKLVNPQDAGDIAWLYKFSLSGQLEGQVVVRASLEFTALANDEVPLVIQVVPSSWTDQSNWTELQDLRAGLEPESVTPIEPATEGLTEVGLSEPARVWVENEQETVSVLVTGLPGVSVETVLGDLENPPVLRIVYTRNVSNEESE